MTGDQQHPTEASDRGEWLRLGVAAIAERARRPGPFTAWDIAAAGLPEPPHRSHWGLLLGIARREGLIVPVAVAPSSRPRTTRSLVRVWIGACHVLPEETTAA